MPSPCPDQCEEHAFDTGTYDTSHEYNVLDIHFGVRGGGNDKKVISGSSGIRAVPGLWSEMPWPEINYKILEITSTNEIYIYTCDLCLNGISRER